MVYLSGEQLPDVGLEPPEERDLRNIRAEVACGDCAAEFWEGRNAQEVIKNAQEHGWYVEDDAQPDEDNVIYGTCSECRKEW